MYISPLYKQIHIFWFGRLCFSGWSLVCQQTLGPSCSCWRGRCQQSHPPTAPWCPQLLPPRPAPSPPVSPHTQTSRQPLAPCNSTQAKTKIRPFTSFQNRMPSVVIPLPSISLPRPPSSRHHPFILLHISLCAPPIYVSLPTLTDTVNLLIIIRLLENINNDNQVVQDIKVFFFLHWLFCSLCLQLTINLILFTCCFCLSVHLHRFAASILRFCPVTHTHTNKYKQICIYLFKLLLIVSSKMLQVKKAVEDTGTFTEESKQSRRVWPADGSNATMFIPAAVNPSEKKKTGRVAFGWSGRETAWIRAWEITWIFSEFLLSYPHQPPANQASRCSTDRRACGWVMYVWTVFL